MATDLDFYAENPEDALRLLHVCYDAMLKNTRQLLFQGAGYAVVSTCDLNSAVEACAAYHGFDLLILCHSVPQADKQHIIGAFRRNSTAPILALLEQYEWIAGVHAVNASEPSQLLHTIEAMLETKRPPCDAGVEISQKAQ